MSSEVLASLAGKRAVVTGGTGLIGRQVVKLLAEYGASVCTVSLDHFEIPEATTHQIGDLTDFNFCLEMTREADLVFHLAGIKGSMEVTQTRPASFLVPNKGQIHNLNLV